MMGKEEIKNLKGVEKAKAVVKKGIGKVATSHSDIRAGVKGAIMGVGGLFAYRKLSDPCVRGNIGNPQKQKECKLAAIRKVQSQIRSHMASCSDMPNPMACKVKLQRELATWEKRAQALTSQIG